MIITGTFNLNDVIAAMQSATYNHADIKNSCDALQRLELYYGLIYTRKETVPDRPCFPAGLLLL